MPIARALLRRPRLFIFDEATSALDSMTEQEISASVRHVSRSRQHLVLLIAHRLSAIPRADTIFVPKRGRIVETGSHQALVERRGLDCAMWRQQIGAREPRPGPPRRADAAAHADQATSIPLGGRLSARHRPRRR